MRFPLGEVSYRACFPCLLYLGFARFLILDSSSTVNPVEAGCLSGSIDDSGITAIVTPFKCILSDCTAHAMLEYLEQGCYSGCVVGCFYLQHRAPHITRSRITAGLHLTILRSNYCSPLYCCSNYKQVNQRWLILECCNMCASEILKQE